MLFKLEEFDLLQFSYILSIGLFEIYFKLKAGRSLLYSKKEPVKVINSTIVLKLQTGAFIIR